MANSQLFFVALLDVQIISLIAFISAVQLIYEITMWFGNLSLNALKSAAGAESAREQPAFKSGKQLFFRDLKFLLFPP